MSILLQQSLPKMQAETVCTYILITCHLQYEDLFLKIYSYLFRDIHTYLYISHPPPKWTRIWMWAFEESFGKAHNPRNTQVVFSSESEKTEEVSVSLFFRTNGPKIITLSLHCFIIFL